MFNEISDGSQSSATPSPARALNKRQANSLATRLSLLEAATQLFSEYGYGHVSVRQIAERANVNAALS
ncbi:TetR family transcriptional regulator [Rhizobium sp. L1K21]|uniref:TetR family transcriptional regulator n=1 Tax=Rhizobium sp. L1K21 TaxID=2954933 RepID=UPI003594649C